ncbi:hypothetical protein [Mycobacterium rhizamassiliense]|uniref:hypothetical protein n=1 Tax=Mycobacterium rhizamassiliense TaxID=1841860 RepID=UPI0012FFBD36|nr:hypothetical protein [Mycobacterium rhizamassiliense]
MDTAAGRGVDLGVAWHQPANPRQLTPRAITAATAVVIFSPIFLATRVLRVTKIFGATG